MAAASAFTIVPRAVLGGPGYVAPSDRLQIGQIGCGTQGLRQVSAGLIQRDDLRITCVCDPNRDSSNYVDWSRNGNRDTIRRLLEDNSWGENDGGIRGGREVAREIVERYYGRTSPAGAASGVRSYADFREMLDAEDDLDAVVVITPDHTHATINLAALEKGVAVISHKPVSNVIHEVRRSVEAARASSVVTHLLAYGDHSDYRTLESWIQGGVIGQVREVHNWTARPFWPQGWLSYPDERPPVPEGFDWQLWLGPEPDRPYHPSYTFALYRGWYAYGGGCFADMGNYSLWNVYRMLQLGPPVAVEAQANTVAFVDEENVSRFRYSDVAYPVAGTVHFEHAARGDRPAVDVYWYEGGIKPQTPSELRESGEALDREGMLFVGEGGTILCDFLGRNPRILSGAAAEPVVDGEERDATDAWVGAIRDGTKSPGSFESVEPLAEATALAGIAFRRAGRRLLWDSAALSVTNDAEANAFIRREYRPGWELA